MPDKDEFLLDTGQDEVDKWSARIQMAIRAHSEKFEKRARRNLEYYLGQQFPDDEAFEESRVPMNFVASVVDSLVPAVYTRNPKVIVSPKVPDRGNVAVNQKNARFAKMFQGMMNQTIKEIKFKKTAKRAIKDGTLTSRGIVKLGFSGQLGKRQGRKYLFFGPKKEPAGVPLDENMNDTYVKKQRVWAERISPFRFYYDPEAQDLEHAAWCVQEVSVPIHRVVNNPVYNQRVRRDLKPSGTVQKSFTEGLWEHISKDSRTEDFPEDVQRVILWEIWDRESKKIRVLAKGNQDLGFLRDDPWEKAFKGLEGFPFKEYQSIFVPDSQWGTSEVDRIIEGQDEFNIVRDMQFKHLRRAMASWVVTSGSMDTETQKAWREGELLETFFLRNVNDIKPLMPPSIPESYFAYERSLKQDMSENSKLPSWRRAGERIGARSATEVNEISRGIDVVTNEKVDVVQDFILDILQGMAQIMQEKYTMKQIVPVMGERALEWREFTVQEIKEQLDIQIVPYSAVPMNPNQELAHYREFLPIMVQAQQAGVPTNLLVFLQEYAKRLQITNFDDFLGPQSLQQMGPEGDIQAQLAAALQGTGQPGGQQPIPGAPITQGVVGG